MLNLCCFYIYLGFKIIGTTFCRGNNLMCSYIQLIINCISAEFIGSHWSRSIEKLLLYNWTDFPQPNGKFVIVALLDFRRYGISLNLKFGVHYISVCNKYLLNYKLQTAMSFKGFVVVVWSTTGRAGSVAVSLSFTFNALLMHVFKYWVKNII